MGFALTGFKIKVCEPKKASSRSEFVKVSKIVRGTIIEEDNTFKVELDSKNNNLILPITPKSFEIEGKINVFTKTKDKNGKRIRLIRSPWKAKFHPGSTEQYLPFDVNWEVKGYIVKSGELKLFDIKDLVGIHGYKLKDIS